MPTLTIDGKQITVDPGTTVIQAAESMGIFVPRYCYHPGLSIAGNCRICLVEIEKAPKLQIACNTPVADGMVVRTNGQKVEQGRQSVLEFLLINHPLDCPVCDQSGECDLQNFYMQYGLYDPRFKEQKVKKTKAVPLGPTVMLDAERCILCSRCVRFTDEITKTGELGIFNRGDQSEIGLYPGKELNNKYSGNVVDVCPVGALTDRDFRFKARVWYLSSSPSVCNGCSQGCNIDIHYVTDRPHLAGGARVMRVKPRYNAEVNQWWICDEGRYGYHFIDQGRLRKVTHRGVETTWEKALMELAGALGRVKEENRQGQIGVIPSAQLTTEELFLIRKLFVDSLGISQCDARVPEKPGTSDDFLIKADKNPNTAGAVSAGLAGSSFDTPAVRPEPFGKLRAGFVEGRRPATQDERCTAAQIIDRCLAGQINVLWVFGHDLVKLFGEQTVKKLSQELELFVFQGSNENGSSRYAHWVLPSAVYAEKDGAFTNCHGLAQKFTKAFEPLKDSRADSQILTELFERLAAVGPEQAVHPSTGPAPDLIGGSG
ncbi:MAG: (2Fe-2S)-binding protein [Candidatus Omnitrophica bacterium]|nr:(2Fe-2S)-binding protein [Candidatus Omnitrophota bacterium]